MALLDSGSTKTWINKDCVPPNVKGDIVDSVVGSTLAGTFKSNTQVRLQDFVLTELHDKRSVPEVLARIFDSECRYDIIIGRDILRTFGIVLDFETNDISCDGCSISMKTFPNDTSVLSCVEQSRLCGEAYC